MSLGKIPKNKSQAPNNETENKNKFLIEF